MAGFFSPVTPSIDSSIISVSSLTHDNNKIVLFADPKSCIMPNNVTNNESLDDLIHTASIIVDPIPLYLDPEDRLFKLPVNMSTATTMPVRLIYS